jgi:predicted RNase H-like HicB family nuclease
MGTPVSETVYFSVTVNSVERAGHWASKSLETEIITYGATREEAEEAAGDANMLLVRELKTQGIAALRAFMLASGIEYSIGTPQPVATCAHRRLERAA